MSRNESGRDHDPWNGGREEGNVDEMVRRIRNRLRQWKQHPRRASTGKSPPSGFRFRWWMGLPILLVIWLLTGFYQVPANNRAVQLRFGAYTGLSGPGLHWNWPWPIANTLLVDVSEQRSISQRETMLTQDGKLASLGLTLHYRVTRPVTYLFSLAHPVQFLSALARNAAIQVAATHTLAELQDARLSNIEAVLTRRLTAIVNADRFGIVLSSVTLGQIRFPGSVASVQMRLNRTGKQIEAARRKARVEARAMLVKAQEQARVVITKAKRAAADQIARARVEISRFNALLPAWRKNPSVLKMLLRGQARAEALSIAPRVVVVGPVRVVSLSRLPPAASVPAPASTPVTQAKSGSKP